MKALKFLLLSLLSIVEICAQAQRIEVSMKNGETETYGIDAIDSVVYVPSCTQMLVIDLEANGTDLSKVADNSYMMTYTPDCHPYVGRVYDPSKGTTLSEGTDYNLINPSDYNAGQHKYIIVLQGMYEGAISIDLAIEKADGYFLYNGEKVDDYNLPIDGKLYKGNSISVNVESVGGGELTYHWYADGKPFDSPDSGGYSFGTDKNMYLEYTDFYWRVSVSAPETKNYKAHTGYGMTTEPVEEAKPYWGYSPFWDYRMSFQPERERLATTLSEGRLPDSAIEANLVDNGDGTKSFTLSKSEWDSNPNNPNPCWEWWFAVPTNVTITSLFENGMFELVSNLNILIAKENDVYGNGSSTPFVINVNGNDYNVYAVKTSRGAFTEVHKIKVTIKN